jgi:hypothetical protein
MGENDEEMMRTETLTNGFVARGPDGPRPAHLYAGPRVAVTDGGEVLCTAMRTAALATNDFVPCLWRSADAGATWTEAGPIWPHLANRWSIFASISRDATGNLYMFGSRSPIDTPGETFWSDATQGLKQNELVWARSTDGGRTWADPRPIAMPIPGAAEAPGALCVTGDGTWIAPYSPYNTFDPAVRVDRGQVVVVRSADQGRTWSHSAMLRFDEANSGGAEAWTVQLADGRLLGTGWHLDHTGAIEHANKYALSADDGGTWTATRSTGIRGQSTALAALPDGRALFIYNQRKHGEIGVWLAVVRPTEADFGIVSNQIIWRAEKPTQRDTSGEHAEWGDFSFGEPAIARLPDGTLLAVIWCLQPSGNGIRYVRLRLID